MNALQRHLSRAAKARWAKASDTEKHEAAVKAATAAWANLTAEERSAEMLRRIAKRKANGNQRD